MTTKTRKLASLIDNAGDVKANSLDNVPSAGLDSAQVLSIAGGLTVYATLDDLPTSGLTSGDQAFITATNRIYVSNGSGWYNVALINATPRLTIDPTGAVALAIDGSTPTVITLTGTDSDNADANLIYSAESDGNFGGLATLSQDSSVFTITPLSEDSATTETSTLTFKASDGISFGSGTTTFTLSFAVADANYTTLLAKADTAGTDNQVDASSNNHTITENGNVTSTAFTPYHPGGYSTYFDGADDLLTVASDASLAVGTGDFTIEFWANWTAWTGNQRMILMGQAGASNIEISRDAGSDVLNVYISGSIINYTWNPGAGVWHHIALVRTGTGTNGVTLYINGVNVATGTSATSISANNFFIGGLNWASGYNMQGYIADVRFVSGTAVYTSAFTPPTAPLTAIANTSLLTCHAPYIADGSTNGNTITVAGSVYTKRFGPYDYLGYTKADHGGSVYFDGSGDYLSNNDVEFYLDENDNGSSSTPSNFSFNFWTYLTDLSAQYRAFFSRYGASWSYQFNWDESNKRFTFNINSSGSTTNLNINFNHPNGLKINQWFYISFRREGTGTNSSTYKLYLNGTQIGGDQTDNGKINRNGSSSPFRIGAVAGGSEQLLYPLTGYISDFELKKGAQGVYSPFAESTSVPIAPITSDANTKLLTCTNKNDIWDASTGNLLTKVGNTTASNTQRKFTGSSAVYFDGTGDYLTFAPGSRFAFGTGDFTIECWVYFNSYETTNGFFVGQNFFSSVFQISNGILQFYSQPASAYVVTGSTALPQNEWVHVAVTRSGNTFKVFLNGSVDGTGTNSSDAGFNSANLLTIGAWNNLAASWTGYMQDLRVTKGLARYTATFTPPTAEFSG